ncbi:hypothetical protein BJ742DRAFT_900165 [Cladochytrium replicatum]|nr:hypothetical protein BJ742DRAFT_900165 [Cladochytrium replicatum]
MAKKERSLNPADAHRRLLRKKEVKKNKEDRKRIRLVSTSQKDTLKLQAELRSLDALERESGKVDKKTRAKKQGLEEKLAKIKVAREKLGLPSRQSDENQSSEQQKPFIPVDPKQSPFYDPIYNPSGAPPPGYTGSWVDPSNEEVTAESTESESDSDSDVSSDDSSSESESSSPTMRAKTAEDSPLQYKDLSFIPLPDGPVPPDEAQIYTGLELPEIRNTSDFQPNQQTASPQLQKQLPQAQGIMHPLAFPHAPQPSFAPYPQFLMQNRPFIPYGAPVPPVPPVHPHQPYIPQPTWYARPILNNAPPQHIQLRPPPPVVPQQTPLQAPAIVSAAPQLRDLQKEVSHLVPPSLLRKRQGAAGATKSVKPAFVNAAPDVDEEDGAAAAPPQAKNLKGDVKNISGGKGNTAQDEYDAFMKSMEGLL